ncbi:MAG: SH3 domain-containing protein [Lachnospiraceae bacterium]|nr:SH3 domain-containing protein [Lachnospiraceae bacterium]
MRRNSFFDEFGSIIKYTVIALMVIILFFVCFAFSRKETASGDVPETTPIETEGDTEETPEATTPEATTPEETTPEATQAPATMTAADGTVFTIVNEALYALDGLNVRELPSTDSGRVGVLEPGTAITRIGISENGWSMIEYNGANAFVSSEFLGATAP